MRQTCCSHRTGVLSKLVVCRVDDLIGGGVRFGSVRFVDGVECRERVGETVVAAKAKVAAAATAAASFYDTSSVFSSELIPFFCLSSFAFVGYLYITPTSMFVLTSPGLFGDLFGLGGGEGRGGNGSLGFVTS